MSLWGRLYLTTYRDVCHCHDNLLPQVATGTMMGLIRGDELEVFHVLYPEVQVGGRVTKAYPLSAIAEVKEEDRERFGTHLAHIYEVSGMW